MTLRAEPLDQEEITSIEEILLFNIPEFEVLIELLQEEGINKQRRVDGLDEKA